MQSVINDAVKSRARNRAIFTPEDYAKTFEEGGFAWRAKGCAAVNPHMKFDGDCYEQAKAGAWEFGWWAAAKQEAEQ